MNEKTEFPKTFDWGIFIPCFFALTLDAQTPPALFNSEGISVKQKFLSAASKKTGRKIRFPTCSHYDYSISSPHSSTSVFAVSKE
jgi:hypothetical protein